jgi:hypothetical protein
LRIVNKHIPETPTNLGIRVKVNANEGGEQESVQTDLFCEKGKCGKDVDVYSGGPNTTHNVVCCEHGLLTSFPDYESLKKFTESIANKILAAHGHGTITDKTLCTPYDDKVDPESLN